MPQKITPDQTKDCFPVMNEKKRSKLNPSEKSISFLLQFARSYHVEKKLVPSLGGMILN
jgi:hypothetical protein